MRRLTPAQWQAHEYLPECHVPSWLAQFSGCPDHRQSIASSSHFHAFVLPALEASLKRCCVCLTMRVLHVCQACRSVAPASCPADQVAIPAEEEPQEALGVHAHRLPY